MTDHSMPDYDSEPNEWESVRPTKFTRPVQVAIKSFTQRIQMAHTLIALDTIKRDIVQSSLANNMEAKESLRRTMNAHAREIGFKDGQWWG